MSDTIVINNPPNPFIFYFNIPIFIFIFLWGTIIFFTSTVEHKWIALLISWGIALVGIIAIIYIEFINRPKYIQMQPEGFLLHYRTKKDKFILFSEIDNIQIVHHKPGTFREKFASDNGIKLISLPLFHVSYEIAVTVREAYCKEIGKYPKTTFEGEMNKQSIF